MRTLAGTLHSYHIPTAIGGFPTLGFPSEPRLLLRDCIYVIEVEGNSITEVQQYLQPRYGLTNSRWASGLQTYKYSYMESATSTVHLPYRDSVRTRIVIEVPVRHSSRRQIASLQAVS